VEHVPYPITAAFVDTASEGGPGGFSVDQLIQRIYIDQANVFAQYPFTSTKRLEISGNVTHLAFDSQIFRTIFDAVGNVVDETQSSFNSGYTPKLFFEPSVALVTDNSFSAFTSPVEGSRSRIQYTLTTGSVTYQSGLVDLRRYFFARPFTFAVRGMSIGRYGSGAEDPTTTWPLYLGDENLVRGYGYNSFSSNECVVDNASPQTGAGGCPVFDRLLGSKVLVGNAEFRIPLFGVEGFGLLNFPFLPTEVSPFVDGGVAYTNAQGPDWRFASSANKVPSCATTTSTLAPTSSGSLYPCADRIPVFSTGLSFRFNLMGYAILEAYYAHPFQRPGKSWVWGFQLVPGW
jgi:outer membrane protein assembly factor BamA